jgi:Zn-dependent peptidase ImmA (M78 family)/DNA-binding XRE family transcriptional regulator
VTATNIAYITPLVAAWARERAGLTFDELAAKLRTVTPLQIKAWERGDSLPTLTQAEELANKLRIPFAALFLSNPPATEIPLPDLRTVTGTSPEKPTPEFLDVVNDAVYRQSWYRDYQMRRGLKHLSFVASRNLSEGIEPVVRDMAKALSIHDDLRRQSENWEEFLRLLIHNAESLGLLVMRSGIVRNDVHRKLDVNEFRGFAISDPLAPLVFINSRDARAAQIFTLAHELAHVWVGVSGISNPSPKKRSVDLNNSTEKFCNQVAAELLVPSQGLLRFWNNSISPTANIRSIAVRYRVSLIVALRRAYDLGKLSSDEFFRLWKAEDERFQNTEKKEPEQDGGNFWNSFNARNGSVLTEAVIGEVRERRVLYTDAARLLGVKVKTIEKLTSPSPGE